MGGHDERAQEALVPFDPSSALLPGTGDARALLALWCLRRAFWPLLWAGVAMAALLTSPGDTFATEPDEQAAQLVSPFAGLVLALALRLVSRLGGLVLADRVGRVQARVAHRAPEGGRARRTTLVDRANVASALRALRWTSPVRALAAARLGPAGEGLRKAQRWIDVAAWVLAAVAAATLLLTGQVAFDGS